MNAIVLEDTIRIPSRRWDLASFRRWAATDDFPERGRISFLRGQLWIDTSPEDLYSHNQVKHAFALGLGRLVQAGRPGRYFTDGALLSSLRANLSTEPDGMFVSWASFKAGRVKQVRGTDGYLELEGAPDMTLEVVSRSSVRRDTMVLRELYWKAGVREYWLVDARGDRLEFSILRHGRTGYVRVRQPTGWVASKVLGKSFRLLRSRDELGNPEFTLAVR